MFVDGIIFLKIKYNELIFYLNNLKFLLIIFGLIFNIQIIKNIYNLIQNALPILNKCL